MKNLYLLKTDKHIKNVGDLVKDKYGDIHIFTKKDSKEYGKTIAKLNIYITSDEEIKDNDYITDGYLVWKWKDDSSLLGRKKIILTTDQDLIKDGVQAIDDEFLEWFVKNPSCEKVEIEKLPYDGTKSITKYWDGEYKIIIPKEETNGCIGSNGVSDPKLNEVQLNQPKQETLEEVAKKWNDNQTKLEFGKPHNASHRIKAFIAGYETAKQQMYSQEEVIEFTKWKNNNTIRVDLDGYKLLGDSMDLKSYTLKELLEIFKKN